MCASINFKKVINIFFFLVTILYPSNPFSASALHILIRKNAQILMSGLWGGQTWSQ
jgi:hypothetical protein